VSNNPAISHIDIVPADSFPYGKKITSDITGAEKGGKIGYLVADAGYAGGSHGARYQQREPLSYFLQLWH
jgi:hypothetical protein